VNGRVAKTVPVFADPVDPFDVMDRHVQLEEPLAPLLAGGKRDAWLVVEAGLELPPTTEADLFKDPSESADDEEARLPNPKRPPAGDRRFHLEAIAPGTWTYAFTNPFLLDLDGGGWTAPGL
jgi:hypothetical protein